MCKLILFGQSIDVSSRGLKVLCSLIDVEKTFSRCNGLSQYPSHSERRLPSECPPGQDGRVNTPWGLGADGSRCNRRLPAPPLRPINVDKRTVGEECGQGGCDSHSNVHVLADGVVGDGWMPRVLVGIERWPPRTTTPPSMPRRRQRGSAPLAQAVPG